MLHGLIAVVLSGLIGLAPTTFGAPSPPPPVTTARLSVEITTTADWATFAFSPATVVASKVLTKSDGVTVYNLPAGWTVVATPGVMSTVTLDVVVEEPSGVSQITTSIAKGLARAARIQIANTSFQPFSVLTLLNNNHDDGVSVQRVSTSSTRSSFLGAQNAPLRQSVDPRRLVLAAYYPWWDSGSYASEPLADRPARERSTSVAADVDAMTAQARAHGIDGFVVDWQGEVADGLEFRLAMQAAERLGGVVTAYVETQGANKTGDVKSPPTLLGIGKRLNQVLAYASSPAFLRSGGVPVVFVYQMSTLSPSTWRQALDALASMGRSVRLVGDAPMDVYGDVSWGYQQYNPNWMTESQLLSWNRTTAADLRIFSGASHLFTATVSPGYDDSILRGDTYPIIPRGAAGERYAATWRAARAASPDWVLVTSWNEWYEGTHVEPGSLSGDLALRQTATESAAFKSGVTN